MELLIGFSLIIIIVFIVMAVNIGTIRKNIQSIYEIMRNK
jgi:hypothetical protein